MIDYLLVFLSVVLLAAAFTVQKFYHKCTGGTTVSSTIFSMVSSICSIVILILRNTTAEGLHIEFSWYSFFNSLLKGICGFLYTIIGFKILKRANVATYMLFLMSGGMIVPAVWGWVFLGEPATVLRILGIIVMIIAIFLSNSNVKKLDKTLIVMCVAVFMLNGFLSVFTKLHQVAGPEANAVDTISYALIGCYCSFGLNFALKLFISLKNKRLAILNATKQEVAVETTNIEQEVGEVTFKPKTNKFVKIFPILLVILYSFIGTISNVLQLEGAKNLPASVLYPIITGGTIALTGIFAFIFFREKPTKIEWFGIVLCIIGTCLFL
ncbi:MAG: EamA family transporter [Clostridia bacterium]|nr:EamA family transporter [Clostridia bacterium]